MDDLVIGALGGLVPGGVHRRELLRDGRAVRCAEAGSGRPAVVLDAALGEPTGIAWSAGSGKVGDEVIEEGGECLGRFLVEGVAGAGDHLDGAAPQGRDGEALQVAEADQLLALAVQDG
jgi:hypothetical protein